jgi:hypothetical protein
MHILLVVRSHNTQGFLLPTDLFLFAPICFWIMSEGGVQVHRSLVFLLNKVWNQFFLSKINTKRSFCLTRTVKFVAWPPKKANLKDHWSQEICPPSSQDWNPLVISCGAKLTERSMNSLMTPWPSSDQDLTGNDQQGHGGRHPRLQEVPASELRLLWRPVGIFLKKCVWNMHVNFFWNFHSNVFTLTIWFIVLNMSVEFVLIYRPHPVYALGKFSKKISLSFLPFSPEFQSSNIYAVTEHTRNQIYFERYPKKFFSQIFTMVLLDGFLAGFSKFRFFIVKICILIREFWVIFENYYMRMLSIRGNNFIACWAY